MLGFDTAARDLGFTAAQATAMQGYASAAITVAAVPEPETWAMMLLGFGAVGHRIGRCARGDQLDERQYRNRIEEMKSDDALRCRGGRRRRRF